MSLCPASIIDRMSELNTVKFNFREHLLFFFHVKLNFHTILKQYSPNTLQHFSLLTHIKTVVLCVMYYYPLSQCLNCCNVLRHISQAFSTDYFPRSRQLQLYKHLSLRGMRVPEPTSRLPFDREETNANGGTKWRQTSKT